MEVSGMISLSSASIAPKTSPVSVQSYSMDTSYPNKITHKLWAENDPRLTYVNYAYQKGWLDFVALLEAENWIWNIDRKSMFWYYRYGRMVKWHWRPTWTYYDYGFCQISDFYHPHITKDDRFYTDWKWQIDKCHELYVWWIKFYWLYSIWKTKTRFLIN